MNRRHIVGVLAAVALLGPGVAGAGVSIDINIAPPPIITAVPEVVVVPGAPTVRYVPGVDFNLFVYGGRYYSLHDGTWFVTARLGAPWQPIVVERVPVAIRQVPPRFYKVPPGHVKQMDRDHAPGGPPGHGRGHGRGR